MSAVVTSQLVAEQRDYAALCDEARKYGVPVSLDYADSPQTVQALTDAVDAAADAHRIYRDDAEISVSNRNLSQGW